MPNSKTEHSRKLREATAKKWRQELVAQGGCQLSVMLSPSATKSLKKLEKTYGTRRMAVEKALLITSKIGGKL